MPSTATPTTIAVIGAGAISRSFHLPALARRDDLRPHVIVVDRDLSRARALMGEFGFASAASDLREVLGVATGAVIAVPHHLHVPLTHDCLRAGVHVLCEKPLAESAEEVAALGAEATAAGLTLLVNNTRRLYPSTRAIREAIVRGDLGHVTRIEFEEGGAYDWPAAGDGYFGVKAGGRGVLFDIGAHVLDLVCWWLDSTPRVERYADDSYGGTEAVAQVDLRTDKAEVHIRLSWLSKLQNRFRIVGSNGASIEHGIYDWRDPVFVAADGRRRVIKTDPGPRTYAGFGDVLIENFVDAIHGKAAPLVPAAAVAPSIALLAQCYAQRSRLPEPWHLPEVKS